MNKVATHDFSSKRWGWNYNITSIRDEGLNISICGWGVGISNGDFLILTNGSDTTRYRVQSIDYYRDPHDMWVAEASFSPREA